MLPALRSIDTFDDARSPKTKANEYNNKLNTEDIPHLDGQILGERQDGVGLHSTFRTASAAHIMQPKLATNGKEETHEGVELGFVNLSFNRMLATLKDLRSFPTKPECPSR